MGMNARNCERCGARLASDNTDPLCRPCQRAARQFATRDTLTGPLTGPPDVPPDFWQHGPLRDSLIRERHIGHAIRNYRRHPYRGRRPIPQETVAAWLSISQEQLARIERGRPIEDLGRLIQWARILRIPPDLLWFSMPDSTEVCGQIISVSRSPDKENSGGEVATISCPASAVLESKNSDFPGIVASDGFGLNLDDEERIIRAVRRPMRVDSSVIVPLRKILAAQRETEDIIGSAPLIKPVTGQLATLEDLVTESRGPTRPEIIDVSAQWAEYSGWLHTSIGHWQQARGWFDRASEWAIEAGNATLAATSLSFKGHLAFLRGQIGPMIGLTEAALRDHSSWVGQRAYDAHQLARGLALVGDSEEAVRNVEEGTALALLADERSDEKPPWIYYYTPPFYALERGLVYRFLGRDNATYNDEAIASLTAALSDIGEAGSSEWAAEYIYHLAVAYMQAGATGKASETALEVLRIARATESQRLMERLGGIYARLAKRWPDDPDVKELGAALR